MVTVTSDSGGTSIDATVTGSKSASITAGAHNTNLAVGTKGVTIKFSTGTTYASGDRFTIHVGNLAASAMALHQASGSITTLSGSATATFENDGTTVSGVSPTVVGTAVAFVTCPAGGLAGTNSSHVVPGMEITYDPNNVWAGSYIAQVSYTIVNGP